MSPSAHEKSFTEGNRYVGVNKARHRAFSIQYFFLWHFDFEVFILYFILYAIQRYNGTVLS